MINQEKETRLERHIVGSYGNVLDFVKQSSEHGKYTDLSGLNKWLKQIARFENKEDRELMLTVIAHIEHMYEISEELRKRFDTTSKALQKVNDTLKLDAARDEKEN